MDSISNCNTSMTINSTSLSPKAGERGLVIFSTKPKILVCDLTLPDESNTDCITNIYIFLDSQKNLT